MTRRKTIRTLDVHPAAATSLRWEIAGIPRPKGSMTVVDARRGHLVDSDASTRWRGAQALAMARTVAEVTEPAGGRPVRIDAMREGYPLQCPVIVVAEYVFPGAPSDIDWPVGSDEPDVDKLLRNTLDALVDARVIADDGLVIATFGLKLYGVPGEEPHADVQLTPAPLLSRFGRPTAGVPALADRVRNMFQAGAPTGRPPLQSVAVNGYRVLRASLDVRQDTEPWMSGAGFVRPVCHWELSGTVLDLPAAPGAAVQVTVTREGYRVVGEGILDRTVTLGPIGEGLDIHVTGTGPLETHREAG
jgi:hypothetical protein